MKPLDYTRKELNIGKVLIIAFMVALLITALTGCAITYETPKCELMLRGEECLSDHRCCNTTQTYYQTYPNWYWWSWNRPIVNKTIIINKPNNKPNNRPNRPNRPNNKPNNNKGKKR